MTDRRRLGVSASYINRRIRDEINRQNINNGRQQNEIIPQPDVPIVEAVVGDQQIINEIIQEENEIVPQIRPLRDPAGVDVQQNINPINVSNNDQQGEKITFNL